MSIINQMLLKLEKRHAMGSASLPEGVRAVAAAIQARRSLWVWAAVIMVLVIGGGYYGWNIWHNKGKPVKTVMASGKIPGKAAPAAAPVTPPNVEKPDDKAQLIEAMKKIQEESDAAEALKKSSQKKADTGESLVEEGKKRHSRENAAKQNQAPRNEAEPEIAIKSISPQQQALASYQRALTALQQGRVSEARSALEEALGLDPRNLDSRQALAALMVEQRQYGLAESLLQEGLDLNIEQYGFAMALARLQVERNDIRTALDTLNKSLPHASGSASYQAFLAAVLQRAEQHKKAIGHYQAALLLAPSGTWQIGLGISLQAENRLTEAQEAFARAKVSNELTPELLAFAEQRLRMISKTPHLPGEGK